MSTENIKTLSKSPEHRGAIFQMEADAKGMVLLEAKEKSLKIYLLVDPESDRVLEAKFFTYGGPIYTAIAETVCRLFDGNILTEIWVQGSADIELYLRDEQDVQALDPAGPELSTINPIFEKLESSYPETKKKALNTLQTKKVLGGKTAWEAKSEADEEWKNLSKDEKIAKINLVVDEHIRHGLQMDGGDIIITDIENDIKIIAEYQGACGSCGSAVGGTLFFIEDTLRKHVHPALKVEPTGLNF
jgi:NifU-like protein